MEHAGNFSGKGKYFALVVSRFNEFITRRLLSSAVETLKQSGAEQKNLSIVWVPGALEIPFFCKKIAIKEKPNAIVALGCVLRGGTFHYETVCHEVVRGVSQAALETGVPMAQGIITADTLEDAIDRAGLKSGNKGAQAALAAVEIANLSEQIFGKRK